MKFARGLVVASVVGASVALATACGSAPDPNLFSESGGGSGHTGGTNTHAGSSAASGKQDNPAGSSSGPGGNTSGGDVGVSSGSSGLSAGGMSNSGGSDSSEAGEGGVGAPGAGAAGASAGDAGTSGASTGGAAFGGAGAGGTGIGGAAFGGAGAGGTGIGGAAGGSGVGGAGTAGASGGGAGAGGSGGANGCPTLAPADKTDCTVSTPSSCFYPGVACSCLAASDAPASTRKWACYGTPDKCPGAKPTAGNSCKQNIGAECPYSNQDYCICKGNTLDASWVCQSPTATCLTNKPPQNLACGPVRACQYSDVSCFCNASSWSCLGG